MTKIIEKAWEWLADANIENSTILRYVYSLGHFVRLGIAEIEQIDKRSFMRFAKERESEGVAPSTINHDLAAISSFCRWLWERDQFPLQTLLELRQLYHFVPPPPSPDYLTPEKFLALRTASASVHPTFELAVALGVHTGLRFSELRRVWFEDFDFSSEHAFVRVDRSRGRETKTKRPRTVPICEQFAKELVDCYGLTRGLSGPVFRPRVRGGVTTHSIYVHEKTLRNWLHEARQLVGWYFTWITMRHTFATWHVQSGTSIALVAQWLGNNVNICFRHYSAHVPGGNPQVEEGFKNYYRLENAKDQRGIFLN
jgi:integrase